MAGALPTLACPEAELASSGARSRLSAVPVSVAADHGAQGEEAACCLERAAGVLRALVDDNRRLRATAAETARRLRELQRLEVAQGMPRVAERLSLARSEIVSLGESLADAQRQCSELIASCSSLESRCAEAEMEYSNLLNLYVASTQLHSSLDFDEVIERVRAIVLNIIGAVVFAMYLADERGDTYPIVLREGGSDLPAEIVAGQGRAGKAIAAREMDCVAAGRALAPAAGEPIACVPLEVGGEAVGVLVIHELLAHKSAFDPVDLDLLRLLQTHAAGALFAAHAYASAQRRSEVIDGLLGDVREQFERLPR